MRAGIGAGAESCVLHLLAETRGPLAETGNTVDDVHDQVKAVEVIEHGHVEGSCRGALFPIAPHMQVGMVGAAVREAMDQPRIAVVGEDDGAVAREELVELAIGEAVRVRGLVAADASGRPR